MNPQLFQRTSVVKFHVSVHDLGHSQRHHATYFLLISNTCFGACRPGDRSHSVMFSAVSACRTRCKISSRALLPGGSLSASAWKRRASSASRSSKVSLCVTRRRTRVMGIALSHYCPRPFLGVHWKPVCRVLDTTLKMQDGRAEEQPGAGAASRPWLRSPRALCGTI